MIWGSNKPKIKFKNILINICVIIILLIGSLPFVLNLESKFCGVRADIITVNDDGSADYTKIQDAINASKPGDIIYVDKGKYYENIIINKSISLIGNDKKNTIINGNGIDDVVKITANWVNISNFTIYRSGNKINSQNGDFNVGIELYNVNNITIKNNNCSNNYCGIWLKATSNNNIVNNTFNSNEGIGIFLRNALNNVISNNNCLNNFYGIFSEDSNNNLSLFSRFREIIISSPRMLERSLE